MDKEQAKFILHSFRPDGADAADADFADALQLAVEDRELGEWLAHERASDSNFAAALSEVEIPDELRIHILTVMRGEQPSDPAQEAEMDALLSDAISHVEPPDGLRDQILAAMYVQENQSLPPVVDHVSDKVIAIPRSNNRWLQITSLAAAIVLGGFLALQIDLKPNDTEALASDPRQNLQLDTIRVSSSDLQHEAARMLNTKFALDVEHPQKTEINTWLANNELPAPARLPAGLRDMEVMGCKKIQLAGDKTASLLCFIKNTGGMVHLVVINNDYIKDSHLPGMDEVKKGDCHNCPKTGWNMTSWRDRENTFLLFAKKDTTSKEELIQYF